MLYFDPTTLHLPILGINIFLKRRGLSFLSAYYCKVLVKSKETSLRKWCNGHMVGWMGRAIFIEPPRLGLQK